MSIPFRCVATDLVTGQEVVLSHGSLSDAIRASMSVPGVFAPVRLNGRLLVDGGVDIGEFQLVYRHDSLDSFWFPSEGMFHSFGYRYASTELGAAADYQQFAANGSFTFSPTEKNAFLLNYELGYSFDDKAPVERWYELGGFGRLSGLIPDQLSGRQLGLLSLAYHRRLSDISFLPAFAGITLEAGNFGRGRY